MYIREDFILTAKQLRTDYNNPTVDRKCRQRPSPQNLSTVSLKTTTHARNGSPLPYNSAMTVNCVASVAKPNGNELGWRNRQRHIRDQPSALSLRYEDALCSRERRLYTNSRIKNSKNYNTRSFDLLCTQCVEPWMAKAVQRKGNQLLPRKAGLWCRILRGLY